MYSEPYFLSSRLPDLGPLHMSQVTRLLQLPGQILLSVHMENFSLVNWDEIQETKPKWWDINLYRSQLF